VLVPLIVEPGQAPRLVFTVRHADLPSHPGQISFPGGKRETGDRDLVHTALREANEELGIPETRVEPLGLLDDIPSPYKYMITPVVALVRGPIEFQPSTREVAEVFSCTLERLRAPGCYVSGGTRMFFDVPYQMHEYHYESHRIWGATARMVHQLLELVAP
jgi:8-oxo-dGTP pyrophosphatase MutT (NUDIX family)